MSDKEMTEMEFLDALDPEELEAYAYYTLDELPPESGGPDQDEEIIEFVLDRYEDFYNKGDSLI